jgi:type VI secretion system protein ImpM
MTKLEEAGTGFYGKVRTHGDFVGRGLSHEFVVQWDAWLQRGLLTAQQRLGDAWLRDFLGMPLWCFAMKPGVMDDAAYAGVMMPGIDAVGRYFPFVVARPMDQAVFGDWLRSSLVWYEHAAALALSTLKARFALTEFETELEQLDDGAETLVWRDTFKRFLSEADVASVWWTATELHAPQVLHKHDGEPDAALFLRLLEG